MGKILVIAEKPSAGKDMAKVLGVTKTCSGYMEGEEYIVTWALGHLIGLKNPEETDPKYKKWRLEDLPLPDDNGLKILPGMEGQFRIIKKLIHRSDVDSLINAGDAGREGYLIQSWIYRMAGNQKPVKVLWASSLTDEALRKAFANLKDESEFQGILEEAEARAIGDQKFGYNYSRMLTITKGAGSTVLSYGRCQTPLLNMIVQRDREIDTFQPKPYYCLECTFAKGFKGQLLNENEKTLNFAKRDDAEKCLAALQGMDGTVVQYQEEEKEEKAPLLYNLAELQAVCGKKFGYTAEQTLAAAQVLYEKHKVLSYPRTDSRALSMDLYGEIRQHLESCRFGPYQDMIDRIPEENIKADKRYFNDAKVTDHHALIPTIHADMGKIFDGLAEEEKNIFDEIIRSLIAVFYPPYSYSSSRILVDVGGNIFQSGGTTIRSLGYKEVLKPAKEKGKEDMVILPQMSEGDKIAVDKVEILERKTTAPTRFNVGNIIKVMEKHGIGTSATRAEILKKLEKRKYITLEKGKYISTELGRKYVSVIPEELKAADLTRKFEERLSLVNSGELSRKEFLTQIDNEIIQYLKMFNEQSGDEKLGDASSVPLGKCPVCGKEIREGKKNYYCSGYKDGCNFFIMKTIAGKAVTPAAAAQLLRNGVTGSISGFNKKNGEGTFSAKLALDEEKKVVFRFDGKKTGRGKKKEG